MKHNMNTMRIKVFLSFHLLLISAMLLSMSSTYAQSSLVSDSTARKSAEFITPVLSYSSVFVQYQGYQEGVIGSWREANDTVGRIGGWRYYSEEASQPDQSDQQSVAPPQPLTPPLLEESGRNAGHEGKP